MFTQIWILKLLVRRRENRFVLDFIVVDCSWDMREWHGSAHLSQHFLRIKIYPLNTSQTLISRFMPQKVSAIKHFCFCPAWPRLHSWYYQILANVKERLQNVWIMGVKFLCGREVLIYSVYNSINSIIKMVQIGN